MIASDQLRCIDRLNSPVKDVKTGWTGFHAADLEKNGFTPFTSFTVNAAFGTGDPEAFTVKGVKDVKAGL